VVVVVVVVAMVNLATCPRKSGFVAIFRKIRTLWYQGIAGLHVVRSPPRS
jgi:hypothetical protein